MSKLRRSLVINFFSSSGAVVLQFIASVIIARMLSPHEIGVFSMTVVFVNIAHIFRDFGVSTYLQREPNLTEEKMRAAIGVMFTSSWIIAISLFFASDLIARALDEPSMVPVMQVLAIGFLFNPFGSVTHALLSREFAADKQAYVTAAGTISFCVSSVALAALGFGKMSLAWANLINIVVCGLAYIPLRPKGLPWLPSFRHWRDVVHFGMGSLIASLAQAVNNAVPDILLGKLGGARLVGLFSRANSTVTIFTYVAGSTVSYGAVSYLSQSHHRGESLVPVLRRSTSLLTGVGWPALALTALLGKDIVLALYGPTWLEGVPAILPLTIAAAITMLFTYTPHAFTAIGRPYLGAAPLVVTLLARIGFGYYLFDGTLISFSWAIMLATLVAVPIMLVQQSHYLHFGSRHLFGAMRKSAVVTVICLAATEGLRMLLPQSIPALARLAIIALPLMGTWYLALRVVQHELLGEVHHLWAALKARCGTLRVWPR